jgi:hypothetical protein
LYFNNLSAIRRAKTGAGAPDRAHFLVDGFYTEWQGRAPRHI